MGRPSIDPELMIRMLIVGYVFAIRSERLLLRISLMVSGDFTRW
jgi:transposase